MTTDPSLFNAAKALTVEKISQLRKEGLQVYFTQAAGPNLKLLFQEADEYCLKAAFPNMIVVHPFPR